LAKSASRGVSEICATAKTSRISNFSNRVVSAQELPEGQDCRIVNYLKDYDPRDRTDWERGFRWLKKRTEEFRNVFGPRVRALSLDEQTE